MNIAQLSIDKKTITVVITVLLLFGGIKSYMGLGRLEDPEFTVKTYNDCNGSVYASPIYINPTNILIKYQKIA